MPDACRRPGARHLHRLPGAHAWRRWRSRPPPLPRDRHGAGPAGPEYPHQILNRSDAPPKCLSIGTLETPEICEYPDSGSFLAEGSPDRRDAFDLVGRRGAGLDDWGGEP